VTLPQQSPSGRFIPPAEVTGGYVQAETLAALNSLPVFQATLVYLSNLVSVGDENGGLFEVVSGQTSDGWLVIDLSGVHAGKQLRRIDNSPGNAAWLNTESTATAFSAANTPTLCPTDHVLIGCGPWAWNASSPERFQWQGKKSLMRLYLTLNLTGTIGDRIWVDLVEVDNIPPNLSGLSGGSFDANGTLIVNAVRQITMSPALDTFQLAFENKSSTDPVTLVVDSIKLFRTWGNENTFYS